MTQLELGQKIHMFLLYQGSVAQAQVKSGRWQRIRRGREHNLAHYEAELSALGLAPSRSLQEHPAYLVFREAAAKTSYVDPDETNLVALGENLMVDAEAVMDVSSDDLAHADISWVNRTTLYVDLTTGDVYADDFNPDSDHRYQFVADRFLTAEWREKAKATLATHAQTNREP